MTAAYLIFVLGVVVVAGIGGLVLVTDPSGAAWCQNVQGRLRRIRDSCVAELGRYLGAVAVLLAGAAATVIICWPFGRFARRFVSDIDAPFLRWTQRHVSTTGSWHHFNAVVTNMGNRPVIKIVVPVATVVLAALWARRGFWIPILVVPLGYVFEKFSQTVLGKVADRPPTSFPDFGTYPSGGCGRLIVVYGLIWYMVLLTFPSLGRRWRVAGFTVVAVLAWIEGYTRVYLIKHWALDVVGGWLFGTLLLLAAIGATSCFARRFDSRQSIDRNESRRSQPAA